MGVADTTCSGRGRGRRRGVAVPQATLCGRAGGHSWRARQRLRAGAAGQATPGGNALGALGHSVGAAALGSVLGAARGVAAAALAAESNSRAERMERRATVHPQASAPVTRTPEGYQQICHRVTRKPTHI